ncbi:Ig-like domain-containing protein [Lujinxingia vulgaris]|nr:Ig-like domain-containing protein [Lujinxingia vulgaris]
MRWRAGWWVKVCFVGMLLLGGCIEDPDLFQPRVDADAGVCETQTIDCEAVGGCGLFDDGCGGEVDCGLCPDEERLMLRPAEVVLEVGERATLEAFWLDASGEREVEEALRWTSSSDAVAVDASGQVEALRFGEAEITAELEDGSARAEARVQVAAPLAAMALSLDPARVHVGEGREVEVTFMDANGDETAPREVEFSSSDPTVMSVDASGRVYGVASGQATLRAQVVDVEAELAIEVYFAWKDVAAGGAFSCGLSEVGEAYCWGVNTRGQLGDGTLEGRAEPRAVQGELRFETLSAGLNFVCGLSTAGETYCWGGNGAGQAGVARTQETARVPVPTRLVRRAPTDEEDVMLEMLDASAAYTCGVVASSQGVMCWGANDEGQIGQAPGDAIDTPTPVGDASFSAERVATAHAMTCAQRDTGEVACWGSQDVMKLAFREDVGNIVTSPVALATEVRFEVMAGGERHFCGLTADGELYCWGINSNGELASGDGNDQGAPQLADTASRYAALAVGTHHGCAITGDRAQLECWGANDQRQVSEGGGKAEAPREVALGVTGFAAVSVGTTHSCVVTQGGDLLCFGRDDEGQTGPGEGWLRTLPRF